MRAISQDTYGGPEVLREVEQPVPALGPGQILVEVKAAGVNPTDWRNRAAPLWFDRLPLTLGFDVSGVVAQVGYGVTIHQTGDEVFGMLPYPQGIGAYAEYVAAPARAFVPKPTEIDHVQAAAIPLAALTAYQALVDTAHITPGQRVLIHAAAGGVGHLAVQIAKHLGAYVIGTASAGKHDLLRSLGADEVIDYISTDFRSLATDIDAALVPMTGETRSQTIEVLRPGATLVTLLRGLTPEDERAAAEREARLATLLVEHDQAGMAAIAEMIRAGHLRAHVQQVFPLTEVAQAHALGEEGHLTGKLVLVV